MLTSWSNPARPPKPHPACALAKRCREAEVVSRLSARPSDACAQVLSALAQHVPAAFKGVGVEPSLLCETGPDLLQWVLTTEPLHRVRLIALKIHWGEHTIRLRAFAS